MNRFFQLIYRYRAFLIFILLEVFCYWLMIRSNPYHSASFFHSSNRLAGNIYETRKEISDYFILRKVNNNLAAENAKLRENLYKISRPVILMGLTDSSKIGDVRFTYDFISAKVVNNTISKTHNHVTLNKGARHGIEPGMGVVSSRGVVGIIRSVSRNFSTAYSLVNTSVTVSSEIKRTNTLCTVNWDGKDPQYGRVLYVPRHIDIQENDTLMTSGYNAVFPEKIMIGTVEEFSLAPNESFYHIKIKLAEDFASLSYVYVIKNPGFEEKEILESEIMLDEQ